MKITLEVEVEKRPTNEVEGNAWQPSPEEVADELFEGFDQLGDTGWIVTSVRPKTAMVVPEGHYSLVLTHPDGHRTASKWPDEGQGRVEAAQTLSEAVIKHEEMRADQVFWAQPEPPDKEALHKALKESRDSEVED